MSSYNCVTFGLRLAPKSVPVRSPGRGPDERNQDLFQILISRPVPTVWGPQLGLRGVTFGALGGTKRPRWDTTGQQ